MLLPIEEMGGLADAYLAFEGKWTTPHAILADPGAFRAEANEVFNALARRVKRENEILYPILDKLEEKRRLSNARVRQSDRNQVTAAR